MAFIKYKKEGLNTLLIEAAVAGNIENVKSLLKRGADVDARNENGSTAMMLAAWSGHLDTVKYLVERGADPSLKNNNGETATMLAIKNGYKDIADYLNSAMRFNEEIIKGIDKSNRDFALNPELLRILRKTQE